MNKELMLKIYSDSAELLLCVLRNISVSEINFKPSGESRSIAEMIAHIVRVDNYFLKKLGEKGRFKIEDLSPSAINSVLPEHFKFMKDIIVNISDDSAIPESDDKYNNWFDCILHISQHYLYHFSQMVYLRRADNRNWETPLHKWEELTYLISFYLKNK